MERPALLLLNHSCSLWQAIKILPYIAYVPSPSLQVDRQAIILSPSQTKHRTTTTHFGSPKSSQPGSLPPTRPIPGDCSSLAALPTLSATPASLPRHSFSPNNTSSATPASLLALTPLHLSTHWRTNQTSLACYPLSYLTLEPFTSKFKLARLLAFNYFSPSQRAHHRHRSLLCYTLEPPQLSS